MTHSMPPSGGPNAENEGGFPRWARRFVRSIADFFPEGKRETVQRFTLFLATGFILTLLIIPTQNYVTVTLKRGDVATTDIKSTHDYLLEDTQLTERQRAEAEASAPYVYTYNPNAADEVIQRFSQALTYLANSDEWLIEYDLKEAVGNALAVKLTEEEFKALTRVWSDRVLLAEINRLIRSTYRGKIIADKRLFLTDIVHGALIINSATRQHLGADDYGSYQELSQVQDQLAAQSLNSGASPHDLDVIKGILVKMAQPNVTFDREATQNEKHRARAEIHSALFQIRKGEVIIRRGEVVTQDHDLRLKKMQETQVGINKIFFMLGMLGLVLVLLYFPIRFARKNIRKFKTTNRDLLFLAYVTVGLFVILKAGHIITNALDGLFFGLESSDYFFLLPFAVGPMLVRIVLNSEVALVYSLACIPLVGLMFDGSLMVALYALLGGVVGAHGVRQCIDRSTIYTAGLKVSVVSLILGIGFQIIDGQLFTIQTPYIALFAIMTGILTATLVTGTIPVIEALFKYTTDIKLLELANLNAPMLRDLMIRAPGTYHHSILVGNLVEAAAEAIGANPLLARAAAYYHDIGKTSKPQYFIENLGNGENKHDKLSPNMSALILISHVKEGVELAKEKRIGSPIIDIIRQSHGTALISFFYKKAKSMEQPDVQSVDERDFRYPGPKPQTREAGLVMLADAVEAASRTLTDPTPARIQGLVQKIINNIFIDGQLDECELTLKNLHEIAKSFNGILAGIFHQRIDYPEPAYKVSTGGRKAGDDNDREQTKTPSDSETEGKKNGGEDLKRLGISK